MVVILSTSISFLSICFVSKTENALYIIININYDTRLLIIPTSVFDNFSVKSFRLKSPKTTQYTTLISDLQAVNEKISDMNASKNLIPNLLNQIMSAIDETVQITSIENTTGRHIVIVAQSSKYPGLGYFKTRLKTKNILQNVVSGSSVKQNGVITVTIEGDLP